MSDEGIRSMEEELDAPIDYRGINPNIVSRGLNYLASGIRKVRSYFGRRPSVRKYSIERLDPHIGGMYSPDDQVLTLNASTLESDPEFGEEAGVHEVVHDVQNQTGSIKAYSRGLERYGILGLVLLKPVVEGVASFYTERIQGKTKDGYGLYRAGAKQMASDHGEKSLINPSYIVRNLAGMIDSFLRGAQNYRSALATARA